MAVTVGVTPGTVDLQGVRGDKWGPITFTAQTALDLSGRTWLAQIRTSLDEPTQVVAAFTVDSTEAATGTIRLTLPPAESTKLITGETAGFPTGKATYFYDVQATSSTDPTDVKTWFAGKVKVTGDVSVVTP